MNEEKQVAEVTEKKVSVNADDGHWIPLDI